MKIVKAVAPYHHPGFLNFKTGPYEAWKKLGGVTVEAHYPWRFLHGLVYRWELPVLWRSKKEARLRFVEAVSISFDTFPDYARYEIIPFVWDCWPRYFEKICAWLKKHEVRTAIFTSSQTAEKIRDRFPQMNVLYSPEGVDTSKYIAGKLLSERSIDVLEFGRSFFTGTMRVSESRSMLASALPSGSRVEQSLTKTGIKDINYVCTKQNGRFLYSNEQLVEAMGDAKVAIALPRSVTDPKVAGDIETLTQRYWESMLSRMVMVGKAPKELTDLIGYDPVIPVDKQSPVEQIEDILTHVEDYQSLVDKNCETALRFGDWSLRMKLVMEWLKKIGYDT